MVALGSRYNAMKGSSQSSRGRSFYVPTGKTSVGGYASETTGRIVDSAGRRSLDFDELEGPGYFDVPVPPGTDGKLWKIE